MGEHSKLAPSSAGRWVNCPGSVALQEQHPDNRVTIFQTDGTTVHDVSALALQSGKPVDDIPSIITDEMAYAADMYIQAVQAVVGTESNLVVELRMAVPQVHQTCFGTPDAYWFDHREGILHVWDLKYGWGIVEAKENWQLILYALGIIALLPKAPIAIHLHIVQPRPYHWDGPVRTWMITYDELLRRGDTAKESAELALAPNPPTKTGPHCRYCSALVPCESTDEAIFNVLDVAGVASAPDQDPRLIGYKLMILRRASEMVKHQLAAVEQVALGMKSVPGWEVENKVGKLCWDSTKTQQIADVAALCGIEAHKPPELKTPTQLIKAGVPKELVTASSTRSAGKSVLVPAKDSHILRIFENG